MKLSILFSALLLSFLLISCGSSYSHPLLDETANLLDTQPDSALNILETIEPDKLCNDKQKMYYRLLLIEAKDKLYQSPQDDKDIIEIMDFFINKKREVKLYPEIYYYAGRVYSELKEDAKALEYFDKSLGCLKKTPDISLENRIHAQKAGLYSIHNLGRHALNEIRMHVQFTDSLYNDLNNQNHLKERIGARLSLAAVYRQIGASDSVWKIYNSLEKQVNELNDSVTTSIFHSQIITTAMYEGDYHKADSVLGMHKFVYNYYSKPSVATIVSEAKNKLTDSILNKEVSEELLTNSDLEIQYKAARALVERARRSKNGEDVLKYAVKAHEIVEKIQKEYSENTLAEMEKILDQTQLENDNLSLTLSNQKKEMWLIIAISSILLLIALIVIFYKNASQRQTQSKLEIEKIKNENSKHIKNLEEKIAALNELKKVYEENSKAEKREIEIQNKLQEDKRKEQQLEAALRLAKIREVILNKLSSPDDKLTSADLNSLRKCISANYAGFFDTLSKLRLSPEAVTDAMFIKIHLPIKLCALYFNKTSSAISNSRRRQFEKLCDGSSFSSWKDFILSIGEADE